MTLADALFWTALPPHAVGVALFVRAITRAEAEALYRAAGLIALTSWVVFVADVLDGDRLGSVLSALIAVYFTWLWWKGSNGRRRSALRELGDKSRRRVQALVDQTTPSPIPSPVGGHA